MADISPQTIELFEKNAAKSVPHMDRTISEGVYLRGNLFVAALVQRCRTGASVLDYGCGPGRISRMVARMGYAVHGMDPAPERIREARRQDLDGLDVTFDVLHGFGGSLPSETYDAVICSSVIEFVEEPEVLLGNLHRTLTPGGVLLLSFANRLSLYRAYAECRFGRTAAHFSVQKNVWTPRQCRRALRAAGFGELTAAGYFEPQFLGKADQLPWWSGCLVGTLGLVVATR
jgi:2-polyprenyl-3-methyl-5-hydroxy-6-metoxy-1,4-benzoquinol methylase